jgi:uncharacterized protein YacL
MTIPFIRVLFLLSAAFLGHQIGAAYFLGAPEAGLFGLALGMAMAGILIYIEINMAKVSLKGLVAAVFGLLLALIVSKFIFDALDTVQPDTVWTASTKPIIFLILAYLGMIFAIRGQDEFRVIIPFVKFKRQSQNEAITILDTSAIIDGRVADIVKTSFLEGHFIVPQFVLKELQTLADSSDSIKRDRGHRGLEILQKMRKESNFSLRFHEEDFDQPKDVDGKLIKLAQLLEARILTNDFNLDKVAELLGVVILNLNELSHALRPVLQPGEKLSVALVKEGREKEQGVGYLNDGTMIVVEKGREHIGSTQRVAVTSVLQTAGGRMVFARIEE